MRGFRNAEAGEREKMDGGTMGDDKTSALYQQGGKLGPGGCRECGEDSWGSGDADVEYQSN